MLTEITLHGHLGETIGSNWNLEVNSVAEAIRAIEVLSEHTLYRYLLEMDKKGCKYRVLINGNDFETQEPLDINKPEAIANSELVIKNPELKTIDIVPVIEGSDANTLTIVAGALLIIAGVILAFVPGAQPFAPVLIIAGIGLLVAGVINLLSQPPDTDDLREIGGKGTTSYMFSGPQNVTREGNPVPVGYGRMLVGSQVIAASYEIDHKNAADGAITV